MHIVGTYLVSTLIITFALAVLEIFLEKYRSGWGGDFTHPFWGRKFSAKPFLGHVSTYHLIMFGVVLPVIYGVETYILRHEVNVFIFPIALWFGVSAFEDFLYFVLIGLVAKRLLPGKGFEHAFSRMIRGEMPWHTYWSVPWTRIKLPWFYFTSPLTVAVLLFVQQKMLEH